MKYLWILLAVMISGSATGQADLLSKKGSKYYYKGEQYKYKELTAVYEDHLESLELYTSGRGIVNAANITAYLGLGFLTIGAVALVTTGSDLGGVIIGGLFISSGLLVELIALIPRAVGNGKLKKAMRTFNFEMIERHGYNEEPSLSFGVIGNGMGLVYQF